MHIGRRRTYSGVGHEQPSRLWYPQGTSAAQGSQTLKVIGWLFDVIISFDGVIIFNCNVIIFSKLFGLLS